MKKRLPLLLLSLILPLLGYAQSPQTLLRQARAYVDTLTSPTFAGRGYIQEGHQKVAAFIAAEFQKIGLRSVGPPEQGYLQPFTIELNHIEGATITIGEKALEAGQSFIVNRFSGAGEVNGTVMDAGFGLKPSAKCKGRILVIETGWPPKLANNKKKRQKYADLARSDQRVDAWSAYKPVAIILLQKKLTAGFGRMQKAIPILEVQKDAWTYPTELALTVSAAMRPIETQNIMGLIPGTENPDSVIVVCAHYDHLGMLEQALFPGANDNASGTTMLLSMAAYFQRHPLKHSLLFIAFGGEEVGLLGSGHFVHRDPRIPLGNMSFLLNLDLMGNGTEGIMAVGGKDFPQPFEQLVQLNDSLKAVPTVRSRKNAPNSDHYYFLEKGVEGFFIYTLGGPPHYHDVRDTADNLEFSRYIEIRELLIRFLEIL